MSFLLDTHVLLWLRGDPGRLSTETRRRLADPALRLYVSAASAWEIAIKQSLGKLTLPEPAEAWLPRALVETGLEALPILVEDAAAVRALPWHHRDPFDRLLVAQAKRLDLTLVTHDARLGAYDVRLLPV